MSKTRTLNPATRRRSPAVPLGLRTAFKMISLDDEMPHSADHLSTEAYPHAARIIEYLYGRVPGSAPSNDMDLELELQSATRRMYSLPKVDAAESVSCASMASFRVGFAVCWLLMTHVNGGTR